MQITGPDSTATGTLWFENRNGTCVIHYQGGVGLTLRNSLGTPTGVGGAPIVGLCQGMSRDTVGGLHLAGCPAPVDLPAP